MNPYYEDGPVTLYHGDCIEVMRSLPDASVDAVVTDPPYGLEFMGREWDSFKPRDIGRGVKVAEERADEMTVRGVGHTTSAGPYLAARVDSIRSAGLPFQEWCTDWASEALRVLKPGGHLLAFGGSRTWHRLQSGIEDAGFEIRDSIAWLYGSGFPKSKNLDGEWEGWGTALKPAFEPIVVARKPLVGTVAGNVVAYGTGALNIDACRIPATDAQLAEKYASVQGTGPRSNSIYGTDDRDRDGAEPHPGGRWPTNVLLDESQAAELDRRSGVQRDGVAVKRNRDGAPQGKSSWSLPGAAQADAGYGGEGGASRFFPTFEMTAEDWAVDLAVRGLPTFRYEAKAPSAERPEQGGVQHPTVKPLALMQWLVRLVTPPGGVVLEPFAGSGTTVEACLREGFGCIAIEREADYLPLIMQRIQKPHEVSLFGDLFEDGDVA